MTMSAAQFNRNCQNFINLIEKTEQYQNVKQILNEWRQQSKPALGAIQTFMRMGKLFQEDQDLVDQFNKCLAKEATIPKKPCTNSDVKQLAMQNDKSGPLLDTVLNWIKTDQKQKIISAPPPLPIITSTTLEQLSEQELLVRIQGHRYSKQVAKILCLYRRCIITLKEFKSLIEPIYLSDPSSFNMLFQYAQELQNTRKKTTIFAPLTDLVDAKYPVEQVGNSYIIIPDGYANYSKKWAGNSCEQFLNRICCSVPLGSEGSFVIARKNEFEEQLFKNEEEKYEIDQSISTIQGAISRIQKNKNLNTPLLQKLLTKIYPYENVFNIMISQPSIAKNIILPRLYQKMEELYKCKQKFNKTCEDVSNKNYTKSLDYRCFYFRKNDKKFNSIQRWDKQIELRKTQILQKVEQSDDEINDRQALQHTRSHVLNTFNNITKQQLFEDKKVDISVYDKKENSFYPPYPHNQILFILSFENQEVFNDVLQIILYHCQKKSILQLIVLRLFKKQIHRRLTKDPAILSFVESKYSGNGNPTHNQSAFNQNNQNSNTNNILFGSQNGNNTESLNEPRKDRKVYKDIIEQFHDLIEEQIESLPLEEFQNPFQGPDEHTFIGTKTIYSFVRYFLTIYQRFLKAKQLSDEKKSVASLQKKDAESQAVEPSLYSQFIAIMIFKIKDPKQNFEEYLRKITSHEAFIYFTLDKFIINITKLINNINSDSLTYKILKDDTKDYQNQLKKWSEFSFPSITNQLTRVYRQNESLFRFSCTAQSLMFISMWDNVHSQKHKPKKQSQNHLNEGEQILFFLTEPCNRKKDNKEAKNAKKSINQFKIKPKQVSVQLLVNQYSEYTHLTQGVMLMKGQYSCFQPKMEPLPRSYQLDRQLERVRKFIKRV